MEMYRTRIVAGNWKMNLNLAEGEQLTREILQGIESGITCKVILAPPYTHLSKLKEILEGSPVSLAAQNCYHLASGAFTGEVSPSMLKSIGVEFVIVGHSERRQLFHETHEIIRQKVDAVLAAGLKPIFCCGEPNDIRQTDTQNIFVRLQLEESLFHLDEEAMKHVCIAYEPIWAIGTGNTATPEQAQEMQAYIRDQIAIRYNKIVSEATPILYGGSIKGENAKEIFAQNDVDGGLVGGASLNAESFIQIIHATC